ncbi:Xaa-Pro peptidase family protein [Novosphingobium sp. PASSN1]|uniref:M24 family metallopeptidase n=1 Tax=Novosphingobium sp. PASSN1 TaxID=2015561 RepID=UPI000BCD14A5|nr:Xaa-Pro peptidase family protein [Novosphingobium sp. PASSN1]OYU33477.1 MAG: peptidase [Novosphingobium sp. PASSN1]
MNGGLSRRRMLAGAGGLAALSALPLSPLRAAPARLADAAVPITPAERMARIAKVQGLMAEQGVAALLVESGSSLTYFTGVRWSRSERITAAVIPASGQPIIVTPFFEAPSVQETLAVPAELRTWHEDASPFALIADALKGRTGPVAVEQTTRAFITEGLAREGKFAVVSGAGLVGACRQIKSPAELALMRIANAVTLAALREARGAVQKGMSAADIGELVGAATTRMGAEHDFALVLLNEASAYPHGSKTPQVVREGSVVLMDCGCVVEDYQSDISRTFVFGEPSARQRKVWDTVRRGQGMVFGAAKVGTPVSALDAAVRRFYEREGWGPGFALPGLSHRAGHGIGMDGHESPYLVGSDSTPLAPGMCFSNEPGLYIPGEFGMRLEDCWVMTAAGPQSFTPLARSLDDPI